MRMMMMIVERHGAVGSVVAVGAMQCGAWRFLP